MTWLLVCALTACGAGGSAGSGEAQFRIVANVSGLTGDGLVLQVNGGGEVTVAQDGDVTLGSASPGTPYAVVVKTQPTNPAQTCTVSNGNGVVMDHDVMDVLVACSDRTFELDVAVSGLAGAGLVIQDITNDPAGTGLTVTQNGTVTLTPVLADGASYQVKVQAQPTNPWQTCTITLPSGGTIHAGDATVQVICTTNKYAIGGTVKGYLESSLVLTTGGQDLPIASGATSFQFSNKVNSGSSYAVTVKTQPVGPYHTICTVMKGTGKVPGADVADVAVTCATRTLWDIWGSGPNDIWAVGDGGVILHGNGSSWQCVASETPSSLRAVWGSGPNDVWAVGGSGTGYAAPILHWDGNSWSQKTTATGDLYGVWGTATNDVWASGQGLLLHWDGSSWTPSPAPTTSYILNNGWGTGLSDVWVAASNAHALYHWNGGSWSAISLADIYPYRVWGSASGDLWSVGYSNVTPFTAEIVHLTNSGWARTEPGGQFLFGLWGSSKTDIWAVGGGGQVLHWDGNKWNTVVANGLGPDLQGVWGAGPGNVWAVGGSSTIVRLQ